MRTSPKSYEPNKLETLISWTAKNNHSQILWEPTLVQVRQLHSGVGTRVKAVRRSFDRPLHGNNLDFKVIYSNTDPHFFFFFTARSFLSRTYIFNQDKKKSEYNYWAYRANPGQPLHLALRSKAGKLDTRACLRAASARRQACDRHDNCVILSLVQDPGSVLSE